MPTKSKLLHHAMYARADEVKELLAAASNPDFAGTGELAGSGTVLHCAAVISRPEIIASLLAAGAGVVDRALTMGRPHFI